MTTITTEEIIEARISLLHQMNDWCLRHLSEREMVDHWRTIRGISDDFIVVIAYCDKYWDEYLNRFLKIATDFNEGRLG